MRTVFILLIRAYQRLISPLFPPSCRFVPTCSAYALEAVSVHGALKGGMLATWRILRCHPFCRGGLDPVPPKAHDHAASTILKRMFTTGSPNG